MNGSVRSQIGMRHDTHCEAIQTDMMISHRALSPVYACAIDANTSGE